MLELVRRKYCWARGCWSSGPQVVYFLNPLRLSLLSDSLVLALPSLAATTGRAAAPLATSSPTPLPATSIYQVCSPLLFPSAVRDGASQTLTKLFVFGSDPVTIYYLLTSVSFAKFIGCTCVHPCPMLGPPLHLVLTLTGLVR